MAIATRVVVEALRQWPATVESVAISESAQPPPREILDNMASDLEEGWDAVVSGRSVSEAVKEVEAGWVAGSIERAELVSIIPPFLIDREMLAGILSDRSKDDWIDPIEAVVAGGGKVRIRS